MSGLSRRHLLGGACACSALALAGCATDGQSGGAVQAGYRPALDTDEGGFWQAMDKQEAELRRSRFVVRDEGLNEYLRGVVCRLAEEHCRDVRVYVLRTPHFNASMAPNGMMQVWTGLLLRVQDEAQLAAILGHEIGHYLQRHTLHRFRDLRTKLDVSAFLGIGIALAGGGALANLPTLLSMASAMGFSRDQEREADDIGLRLMARAGYRPEAASRVWESLIAEEAAGPKRPEREIVFASHPAPEERVATLRRDAAPLASPAQEDGADRFRARIRALRSMLLQDEIRLRQYGRTLYVLDRLGEPAGQDGELLFYRGEVFRLRAEAGDRARARDAFEAALARGDAPPEAWRSLGLVHRQEGSKPQAEAAFRAFLERSPEAADRDLIRSYITEGT